MRLDFQQLDVVEAFGFRASFIYVSAHESNPFMGLQGGQAIEPAVVEKVFRATNGQPGLVSWFGELLTEKYNPGRERQIDMDAWKTVWLEARTMEPINNLLNLIAKPKKPEYRFSRISPAFSSDIRITWPG